MLLGMELVVLLSIGDRGYSLYNRVIWRNRKGDTLWTKGWMNSHPCATILVFEQVYVSETLVSCFERRGGASKLGHSLHRPQQSVQSQLVVHSEGGEDATVLDCADLTFNYINLFENLTGRWKKVPELCTSMERAYELSNLSWIIRKAVTFLKYMEVRNVQEHVVCNSE